MIHAGPTSLPPQVARHLACFPRLAGVRQTVRVGPCVAIAHSAYAPAHPTHDGGTGRGGTGACAYGPVCRVGAPAAHVILDVHITGDKGPAAWLAVRPFQPSAERVMVVLHAPPNVARTTEPVGD
ncbi:hypothetical protein Q5752_001446 [Cryptotrichosporon argae]